MSDTEQQSNAEPVETAAPSLRDAISAAFDKQREASEENVTQEAGSINGPARDEHGRFSKKEGEVDGAEATTDGGNQPVEQQEPAGSKEPVRENEGGSATPPQSPPPSWSVAAKAEFDKLPDAVKADIAKREDEVKQGFARLKELKELEPYQQMAAQHGTTIAGALQNYVAAEQRLSQNPVEGIAWLIQQYRPDLNQLSAAIGLAGDRNPAQPNPTGHLERELYALKSQIAQMEQQEQANRTASLQSEIEAFASKPEHRFFENVRTHMGALMQAGTVSNLSEAYEMACWANPEVRSQMQKDQLAKQEAERSAKARQAAQEAKRSAGSITGSPMPGGASAGKGQAPLGIRESIAAAMEKQHARA